MPEAVFGLIQECLDKKEFTSAEEIEALRLITIVHLFERNPQAEESFRQLLKKNPEFKIDPSLQSNPGELVFLYEDFHTNPRFHIRVQGGINTTMVRELQWISSATTQPADKVYNREFALHGGFLVGIPLFSRNFRLQLGAEYAQLSYALENTLSTYFGELPGNTPGGNRSPDFFQVRLTEVQQYLQVPLFMSVDFDQWSPYNFDRNQVVPFLFAGATYHSLFSASYPEISRQSGVGSFLSSSSFDDITEQRHTSNFSLLAGGGLKFKIRHSYLTMEIRYNRWLRNAVNASNRYSNSELTYRYGQIDSDLTFDTFSSFLGFEIPFYSPGRRRQAR